MKEFLLAGKRKSLTLPLVVIVCLTYFPIAVALVLAYLAYTRIKNKSVVYTAVAIVAIFGTFFGSAWVAAMTSPHERAPARTQAQDAVVTGSQAAVTSPPSQTPTAAARLSARDPH